jgi:hypothetical protein
VTAIFSLDNPQVDKALRTAYLAGSVPRKKARKMAINNKNQ